MSYEVVSRVFQATAPMAVCLCLASTLSGCGGGAVDPPTDDRINASGKVEVDGQPIPAGTITFLHTETGYNAICNIDDGEYESDSGKGPNAGNNTVLIEGKETADGNSMWREPWVKQNVQVGDSEFTEDFSIASDDMEPFDPSNNQRVPDEDLQDL